MIQLHLERLYTCNAQDLDAALWALEVDAAGATPAVEASLHELDGHLSYLNSTLSTGSSLGCSVEAVVVGISMPVWRMCRSNSKQHPAIMIMLAESSASRRVCSLTGVEEKACKYRPQRRSSCCRVP